MAPPETPQRPKATALEVRNKYGIYGLFLLVWTSWCVRDGWFSAPEFEYKTFNKVLTVPSAVALVFCLVMAGSAALTVERQKRQQPPQPPAANPPPPTA